MRPLSFNRGVLLFDGVCNLCNGFINFIIDHDEARYFRFGTLQREPARSFLRSEGYDPEVLDSVVLVENGRLYRESTAALRVFRKLGMPWALLSVFQAVPRPLRDAVYRRIAANRYDWFGTRNQCRLPTPELQALFIDDTDTPDGASRA
ncbi:thiol-disulfide oxidoreductase DCC family protein [Longimonas sp.]|uniref:thiol-disulfide oxidoreductase DCC family protein n=1 Tax=Longimonas sp. TaxID=2039626 RepID=UPI003976ECA4